MKALAFILAAMRLSRPIPTFNATSQRIEVSGEHKFEPPSAKDYRGPCPGLNALANHGYISRHGVASIDELTDAAVKVFGLSVDQASLAAIYSTAFAVSPDLNHISIGAPLGNEVPPADGVQLKIPPQGLNFPHVGLEFDASPTRLDKHQPGSGGKNYDLSLPLLRQLLSLQKGVPNEKVNFDLNVLADHRYQRHLDSVAKNPLFFQQPFTGLFLNGNKYALIPRLFANHSAEHPEGRLDRKTLLSFYGVEYGGFLMKSFWYRRGCERIPDNWYRRPLDSPYDLRKANDDLVAQARRHPEFINKFAMGGNTAGVNTYRAVTIDDLTNGTYSLKTILNDSNLSCLGFLSGGQLAAKWLTGYYENLETTVVPTLLARLPGIIGSLKCKPLKGPMNDEPFRATFPGYDASLPPTQKG
ncbi:Chloroperoxidase [Massariosphaeria phaeospora]|uniref:Chloroperoxidase n=1 Tax=Massariosphaeria phaeospora TaxID=100035 RepID=A0A7C8IS03_9PLEO|nr:Chloroperoxidase [Massariosphaeria phaeospora]